MEMITVTAKTLDEAITKALIQLGTTSDNLEYTVIEKGSAGFLGFIGKKDVVIQAKKKKENDLDDIFSLDEKKSEPVKPAREPRKEKPKQEPKQELRQERPCVKVETKPEVKAPKAEPKMPKAEQPKAAPVVEAVKEPEKKPQHVSVQSTPPIPGGAHPAASPWTMMSPTGSAPTETASPKRNRR